MRNRLGDRELSVSSGRFICRSLDAVMGACLGDHAAYRTFGDAGHSKAHGCLDVMSKTRQRRSSFRLRFEACDHHFRFPGTSARSMISTWLARGTNWIEATDRYNPNDDCAKVVWDYPAFCFATVRAHIGADNL